MLCRYIGLNMGISLDNGTNIGYLTSHGIGRSNYLAYTKLPIVFARRNTLKKSHGDTKVIPRCCKDDT